MKSWYKIESYVAKKKLYKKVSKVYVFANDVTEALHIYQFLPLNKNGDGPVSLNIRQLSKLGSERLEKKILREKIVTVKEAREYGYLNKDKESHLESKAKSF